MSARTSPDSPVSPKEGKATRAKTAAYGRRAVARYAVCAALALLFALPSAAQEAPSAAEPTSAALAQERRQAYARQAATLAIRDVAVDAKPTPLFQKREIAFQVDGTWRNPFDPDEIDVAALLTSPSGRKMSMPAFFHVPYRSRNGQTQLETSIAYVEDGPAQWKVRVAPDEPGAWKFTLRARDAAGKTAEAGPFTFQAEAAVHPGFVRVSPTNPQYFENSGDRTPFYATGTNIAWTRGKDALPGKSATYEYYFGRARGNQNATRVWACHWAWLEWMPSPSAKPDLASRHYAGVGYFNPMISSAFDRVFALAEEQNLRIMLVTDDNNEHMQAPAGAQPTYDGWGFNPYNAANGGPCASPSEVFTQPEARRRYRNRLRYIYARWGYSPSLWAVNTWNDSFIPNAQHLSWLKEMHGYVHGLADAYRPLIFGTNYHYGAQEISDYAQAERKMVPGKPNVSQECYYTRDLEWFAHGMHEEMWKGFCRGNAGTMIWPHEIIDRLDLWSPTFKNVLAFSAGIPLNARRWSSAGVSVAAARAQGDVQKARVITVASFGDVPNWGARATQDRFEIQGEDDSQFITGFSDNLYGLKPARRVWRTTPTFVIDAPRGGTMILQLDEKGGGTLQLVVRAGKETLKSVEYGGERRGFGKDEQWVRVPLASGKNELTLAVEGADSDWLRLRSIFFVLNGENENGLLQTVGRASRDHAFFYLSNLTHGRLYQQILEGKPVPFRDVRLQVKGLADGEYRIEVFDTAQGRVARMQSVRSERGVLPVTLDALESDAAVRVFPQVAGKGP